MLQRNGLVGEKDLSAAIAETVGLRFVDFTEHPINPDAATTIPEVVARERVAIGVGFEGTKLVVAFADPGDDAAVQAVGARDRLRDHPGRRGSLRDPARDRLACSVPDRSGAPSLDERRDVGIADEPEGIHVNELLERCSTSRAPTSTSPRAARRSSACNGELQPRHRASTRSTARRSGG